MFEAPLDSGPELLVPVQEDRLVDVGVGVEVVGDRRVVALHLLRGHVDLGAVIGLPEVVEHLDGEPEAVGERFGRLQGPLH